MKRRGSGILLHITSLPSSFGIGDLGQGAYKFTDFLREAKQSFWQVLPLNPTDAAQGNSPYSSVSAFAGNPLLISPGLLVEQGFLGKEDARKLPSFPKERVDYPAVIDFKKRLLDTAYQDFKKKKNRNDYERFCSINSDWLEDYALFVALKENFDGKAWNIWPGEIRDRQPEALRSAKNQFQDRAEKEKFIQYLFFKQWSSLKNYCNRKDIRIIGDIPIYVNYDSADTWSNQRIFKLNGEGKPAFVAGVPPDYFSKTGQLWGNPVYDWKVLKETRYNWWVQRMEHVLKLYDIVRIDHFRGLVAYWEVPVGEKTAINGKWVEVDAEDFFNALFKHFFDLPIIAEDLGMITADVREVLKNFGFPGMKVLLFAFGEDKPMHPYLPHTYEKNCVVYTGTHDNNTIKGWFEKEANARDKKRLFNYLGRKAVTEELHWELIRLAMTSVANIVIVPLQDLLGLGEEARMNRPSFAEGNWQWRFLPAQLTSSSAQRLSEITEIYGRA
ncbi:MAG: 4-alpha-glucanotransferase [Candidatus Omnitrophota bacterium]